MKKKRNTVIWEKKWSNSGKNGMVDSSAQIFFHLVQLKIHTILK